MTVTDTVLPNLELTGQYMSPTVGGLSTSLYTLFLRSAAMCKVRGVCESQEPGGGWGAL